MNFLQCVSNNENDARNIFARVNKLPCFLPPAAVALVPPFAYALQTRVSCAQPSRNGQKRGTWKNLIQKGSMLIAGQAKNSCMLELLEHMTDGAVAAAVEAKLVLMSLVHQRPSNREQTESWMRDKATEAKQKISEYVTRD